MREDYLANISALEKEYNQYRKQAELVRETNHGAPSEEEAKLRVKAGEAAKAIANMTEGAVRDKYEKGKNKQKELVNEILSALAASAETSKAAALPNPASGGGSAKFEAAAGDVDPSWYRERPKHGFDAVSGMDRVKSRLSKNVARMKRKELLQYLNMNTLNGFLFYGPPGCGKTFLTEAFVHELMGDDYKYLALDAKDIHSKYSGEAEKNVSAVFSEAEKAAPALLFFDEMDAVCTERQQPELPQHTKALTDSFLTAFNHLKNSEAQVYLVGATNYPQNLDTAMVSRMEPIKIPLPDQAARASYFERTFAKAKLELAGDITAEEMAQKTYNYSYRDMEKITNYVKGEIFDSLDDVSVDEAIKKIEAGEVQVTRKLFEHAHREVLPTYDKKYMDALAAWEKDHGIGPDENGSANAPETEGKEHAALDPEIAGNLFQGDVILPEMSGEDDLFTEGWNGTLKGSGYGYGPGHNQHPYIDVKYSFSYSVREYKEASPHYNETAQRLLESCGEESAEAEERLKSGKIVREDYSRIAELNERYIGFLEEKRQEIHWPQSVFAGWNNAEFIPAYDGFNTGYQGEADENYKGICGIVSTCNIINQQTGSRLTEKDGIQVFTALKLCSMGGTPDSNGGTFPEGRAEVLRRFHIDTETHTNSYKPGEFDEEGPFAPEFILSKIQEGFSAMLAIKAQDLKEAGLSQRIRYAKDSIFGHGAGELIKMRSENWKNHVISVAGCSRDEDGNVTGLWINDTGGFSLQSNRVFIDTEKWKKMVMETFGLSIAFAKKVEAQEV